MSDESTPIAEAIRSLETEALLSFLMKQRWFSVKSAAPSNARVTDSVVMPWGNGVYAIARISVDAAGATHSYQLPLGVREVAPPDLPDTAVLGSADIDGQRMVLYDGVHDVAFRSGLSAALDADNTSVTGSTGVTWRVERATTSSMGLTNSTPTKVGAAEQSNTSIVIGDSAILKLFRTLQPGVHPDAEVTRFLTTRANYAHTPGLLASISFESPDGTTAAGMLQQYLPGSTDAWTYAIERGKAYFTAAASSEPTNAFLPDAKRLGEITRALHEALASDDDDSDFAAEPVSHEDLDRWTHRTQRTMRESIALLERQIAAGALPKDRVPEAQALVRRAEHYTGWVNEIDDALGDDIGMRTRTHGDYHLGQVLHTASDEFMIIDFEGEPARPLSERREKTSPLRDVAGMLRSFAYAAATLAMSVEKTLDAQTRELRSARWERDVRAAFLDGYLGEQHEDDHPDVLPEQAAHTRQLIALFETEKAFYELAYELNNRPGWAWIPMRGISKLFLSTHG
jgi:trehalose synthase-fused probable maltokinase